MIDNGGVCALVNLSSLCVWTIALIHDGLFDPSPQGGQSSLGLVGQGGVEFVVA